MDLTEFFDNFDKSRGIFNYLFERISQYGDIELRVTKSQIAFVKVKPFAWVWIPDRYLKRRHLAPLVLTLVFPYKDPSPRWKEIVEPHPGSFTHHLELNSIEYIDAEVEEWLLQCVDE